MAVDSRDAFERINRQAGSGVIIDPAGLVVTNSHVVFGRQAITVTLDDGTVLPARIVGLDPIFDVAVLRIPVPGTGKLPAASFTESGKLHVGDEVFAIGNPLGLEQTLTRGIVSAVNRILPSASWSLREPLIQTDAAINHGNSGGPLVDQCGKVVGINTAMLPDAQGIGFAIPSDLIVTVLPELVEKGRVIRPWLGVQGQVVPPTWKQLVRIPPVDGFLVEVVEPGSPAAKAGLQGGDTDLVIGGVPLLLGGDMIVEMNGRSVGDPAKMAETVAGLKLGETVRLTIVRADQTLRLEIVLEERPILPQDVPGGGQRSLRRESRRFFARCAGACRCEENRRRAFSPFSACSSPREWPGRRTPRCRAPGVARTPDRGSRPTSCRPTRCRRAVLPAANSGRATTSATPPPGGASLDGGGGVPDGIARHDDPEHRGPDGRRAWAWCPSMKAVLSSYTLSLAVFIPVSGGWRTGSGGASSPRRSPSSRSARFSAGSPRASGPGAVLGLFVLSLVFRELKPGDGAT